MKIKRILKLKDDQKISRFLLFLLLAITFWIFTALNRNTSTFLSFQIEYQNVPFGKHLLQDAPNILQLKIQGKGLDIMIEKFKHKKSAVIIDLSDPQLTQYLAAQRLVIPSQSFYKLYLPTLGDKLNVKTFVPDVIVLSFIDKFTKTVDIRIPHDLN
ncbi:MAG: hypothetical protein HKN22_05440, partial [Bacteroidia bacterium]|nr:hypothetical protein [Bacteroidia bacterium]